MQQIINIGAAPNDGTGDPLRTAFDKCNQNFTDLYSTPSGGTGTVTSVSVANANGISGAVANATTTPAITLSLGAITPSSVNGIALTGSSTPSLSVTGSTSISGSSSGTNTGDQTISLTGDVTGTGTGSFAATISTNAVTTSKIANSNVTYAKIQNVAGLSVVGNSTASAAAPSDITGTPSQVLRVNSAGSSVGFGSLDLSAAAATTGTLPVGRGGTGLSSAGSNNQALVTDGVNPYWGQVSLTAGVTGDLPLSNLAQASSQSILLGRGAGAGGGDFQEISIGSGLAMTGTTLSASGGGGGAPTTAEYLVKTADATLTNERVVTDSTTVTANWVTAGQVSLERAALTGDVTAPANSNSTTIATNAVTTTKIANSNVTFAKIENVAPYSVLGNGTGSAAAPANITGTAGQVLRVNNGGTALAFGAVDLSTAGAITGTLGVANGGTGVTTSTGTGSVVLSTSPTLVTPVLGTPTSGTLTSCSGLPVAGTTYAATSRIHGRATAGPGAGEELTLSQVLDLVGSAAQGDILYRGATTWTRLGAGTSGHYLKTQGTGADPVWASVTASGGGSTNVWIPAAQWIPRTTTGCGIDSREQATGNINTDELLFDTATIEYAQAMIVMPSNYNNGTVTARFYWTASAGTASQTVTWAIRGRAFGDNVAIGQTYTTAAQSVTDAYFAANQMHISSATSAITIDGTPAANKPIIFEIYRDTADSLSADARLLGVEIAYTA